MRKLVLPLILLLVLFSTCNPGQQERLKEDKTSEGKEAPDHYTTRPLAKYPKNIILMIGDGMGLSQITAGLYSNNNKLHLQRFPKVGFIKTHASDNLITDSAAGATAFACGVKTYNGAIGVDPEKKSHTSILEMAEEQGKATGLIATSTIVHATPASFIAHVDERYKYEEIAEFFLRTEIDFFVGGGKKFFERRKDGRNLIKELTDQDYVMSDYFEQDLEEITVDPARNFGYFTADEDPLPVINGRDYFIPSTRMALDFMPRHGENGFFLMIEGSQIDWGGHANNAEYVIQEMIEFDKVIGEVLAFAEKDGNTLVIVTADHETGGMCINPDSKMNDLSIEFTTDKHTATMVPVFAFGPGAELFSGIYENYAIHYKMRNAFGFERPIN